MRTAVLVLLTALVLLFPAAAVDVTEEQEQALQVPELEEALPEEAQEILDGLSVTDALDTDSALSRIGDAAQAKLGDILRAGLGSAAAMLCLTILCALASPLAGERAMAYVELGGVLGIAAIAAGDVSGFIGLGTETLHTLSDFSKALLPSLAAAAAATGAVTSAAAKYAATALFLDVLLTAASRLVLPVIYAYIAAATAGAALGNEALGGAARLLKWISGALITALMLAFTGYLSLTGVISGAADAVTTKLTKTAISAALPVVGSIVSDAAGTIVAGASMLRNAIGIFGMLSVIAVCLTPFLTLGVQYLAYKAAAGLASVLSDQRISSLIGSIGTAYGMVLGLVGAGALMLFFSVISSIKAVTGT